MKKVLTENKSCNILGRSAMLSMKGLAALFLCAFIFTSCDHFDEKMEEIVDEVDEKEMKMFEAYLTPLNNSGVTGKATIKYSHDGKFEVLINAKGLTPNRVHPQHIHGFAPDGDMKMKDAVCPPASAAGEDGILSLPEGLPFYGPVLVPLDDNLVPLEAGNFPHVGYGAGDLTYYEMVATKELVQAFDNMYEGTQTEADLRLMNRVIVLHGAFVKDGQVMQRYSEGAEYWPTLPVACGEIMKR
jgi:hypothetical protein